jgi:hypothetical protein
MRRMPTPLALLGIALLGGCAAAESSPAAPRFEPDCSFRSPSTCWTVAGRFPPRRPRSAPPKGDEIRDPSPSAVASKADSALYRSAPMPDKRQMANSDGVRRTDRVGGARDTSPQDSH